MFFSRSQGVAASGRRLRLLLPALLGLSSVVLTAQTPTTVPQTPPTAPVNPPMQSIPAPAPAPDSSFRSVPAPVPATAPPAGIAPATASPASTFATMPPYAPDGPVRIKDSLSSAYIPVDSTVYPMALRLYSLGYLDTAFLSMRPWTRRSLLHMLQSTAPAVMRDGNEEAIDILAKLQDYLVDEPVQPQTRELVYGVDTLYARALGISGQSLRDSYHLGETIANDYGRPYEPGFNAIAGFSTLNEYGRFSLYVRGEYQHAPSGTGYSTVDTGNPFAPGGLAPYISNVIDQIPFSGYNLNQATIPTGNIAAQNPFAIQEATLSFHLLGHEISGGKSDAWLGPAAGSAMAWNNNAQDIYSFRINRVEPLYIPFASRFIGPLRYDFFVGSLKGHTYPNSPWVHSEMFSFAPTSNFQFAFQRTVIWGGEGHEPVTLHTFLRSFFSVDDTESDPAVKNSSQDPGARFSSFSFSWRLPFLSHFVTLYTDSECHDDVSPISAPRRASYRPGVYVSQFPGLRKLDFRIEGANTDVSTTISHGGFAEYYETIQRQAYTNKGVLFGDWIGRQAKGGQAWVTYHLSGNEWVQVAYLEKKIPVDFIPGGTSQAQFTVDVVKRFHKDIELNAWIQSERWEAPIYILRNSPNHDTVIAAQLTWFPKLKTTGLSGK